ncbi:septum formation family protein [Mycobacterium sp. 94-17]|uniref:septum formation family protein n=1 Tax=Mycobacterium sp. 94-17 TaxID=2986147 RepID=UPI002D1F2090|nr:septum formation family protein [Mycobacterium sp. 94-17]MEB4209389.1 septum formation family protein [Mycobacterium sp. 94-17]
MERMSQAPEKHVEEGPAGQAVESPVGPADESSDDGPSASRWPRSLQARATRRALLLTALGGLLIAGLATAIPVGGPGSGRFLDSSPVRSTGTKSEAAFNRAGTGECLMWPDATPESAKIVGCGEEHKFEVAESIDMRTFPGSEYGPTAAPPSPARIQQITQEQCEAAVRNYLGPKFDPNSKFIVSLLWPGDRAWRQSGDRRMLCGLQLPGSGNQQQPFKGKVADVDQSKVWPAGTCLGIDSATNQPTDAPVECAAPHAMEVTGTVNLAEKFPGGLPAEPDQDGFIKDSCTKMTDAYLAPVKLRTTTLTLIYPTVPLASWTAGSREVACSIGATLGNGGWATLLNSARGQLLINGQPPVPPPDIPEERLTMPPIPLQAPAQQPPSQSSSGGGSAPEMPPNNQHLPGQQPAQQAPQQQAPDQQAPPPADNGAPPANNGAPPANPAPAPEPAPPPPPNPAPEPPAAAPAPGG